MGYSSKVGSFNIDPAVTAGNTQAITDLGFQPKVVLFWWSGSTATGDSVAGGTYNIGFGAAISSSSRFCVNCIGEDAQADSDTYRTHYITEIIRCYTDTGTLDGIMDFSSMDAGGFTLIVDDQFTQAYRISYLALGGTDLTNVFIGSEPMHTTVEQYSVGGVGFQPDALITAMGYRSTINTGAAGADFDVGMATGSSNQGAVYAGAADAGATSSTRGYGYNGDVNANGSVGIGYRDAFISFGADGFTLDHLIGATGYIFSYICLKGGQYSVGDLTTRADGDDISETVGFQPVAILFASANRALSTAGTATNNARLSIGAATSTSNRAVAAISDENGLADTETATANYDSAVYANILDDAIAGLMDIKSIDAGGFTAVMDDPDPTGCWVTYLAIGAALAAGTVYTETGGVFSTLSALGADDSTFTEAGRDLAALSATGGDVSLFTDSGAALATATATGADAIIFAEAGTATASATITGTAVRIFNRAGSVISSAVSAGADALILSDSGAALSALSIFGADTTTYTDSGLALLTATVSGADAVTFTDAGLGLVGVTSTGTYISITGVVTTQEGYRWRNDNGSESEATWAGDQDATLSAALGKKRLRVLVDAAGDPDAIQYQLEYRKVGDETWLVVN